MPRQIPDPATPPTTPDEPATPPVAPDASARTFEGAPDLGVADDLAAVARENELRGLGQEVVDEPLDDEPDR